MSIGGEILTALKTRLEGITTANSYSTNVKKVLMQDANLVMTQAPADLPCIGIVDESEDYEHQASSSYWCDQNVILYLGAEKDTTDAVMQQFMTDVRKALYGAAPDATGNTGVTLGGKVSSIHLVGAAADLNMIPSHRVYLMRIRLRSHRTTYRD